jgi:hypothetical protein
MLNKVSRQGEAWGQGKAKGASRDEERRGKARQARGLGNASALGRQVKG